jgi:hypothetical protein
MRFGTANLLAYTLPLDPEPRMYGARLRYNFGK